MLISGTHLGITDQAQQSHNYRYPHEHERIFFVTMYNRNAFVVLSLNRKLIFFQPLTNSIAPSLFHTRKNGGSKVNPQ